MNHFCLTQQNNVSNVLEVSKIRRKPVQAKEAHNVKMLVVSSPDKRILFLSNPYCRPIHDYSFLQSELNPDYPLWFMETMFM